MKRCASARSAGLPRMRWPRPTTVSAASTSESGAIAAHLDGDEWRGVAGGYQIQRGAEAWVRFLSGSHSNVVGLPMFETAQLLRGAGWLKP